MRYRTLLTALLALTLSAGLLRADANQAMERAMGTLYSALVASSRGSIDATSRHLLLLASRWETAAREARTSPPAGVGQDPAWRAAIDDATAMLARARERVRLRDVAGAHAELEGMRYALHEVREAHHAMTFDDYVTEYHEAMERANGHMSTRNEIRLTSKDFADIAEDLRASQDAWREVQARAGALAATSGWTHAAGEVTAALAQLTKAIASSNAPAAFDASARVKSTYFDLLLAIASARG